MSRNEDALLRRKVSESSCCGKKRHEAHRCWLNPKNPYNRCGKYQSLQINKSNHHKYFKKVSLGDDAVFDGRHTMDPSSADEMTMYNSEPMLYCLLHAHLVPYPL